jgi:amino acid transporter
LVGVGALISVAGSDESGMIGTSRLGYALAADGLFPKLFAKVHKKYKTPYASIIIQSVTALLASIVGGLSLLISVSVFFLAVAYLATCASVFPLRKKNPVPNVTYGKRKMVIPVLGIVFSAYLITQCTLTQIVIGVILLLVGVPMYIIFSPKKELTEAKALIANQNIFRRIYRQEHVFLANFIYHLGELYRRFMRKPKKNHP